MTRPLRWALGTIATLLVAVLLAGGFLLWPVLHPGSPTPLRVSGGTTPGSVLAATSIADLPAPMRLIRAKGALVTYLSTDIAGHQTTVTGAVFTPGGDPPPGGWPVVAYAHGTAGINEPCAPSLSPDLKGGITLAQGLVGSGYAVAMADYQGLGAPGVHPYLDSVTAGRNVIDSVRAVRALYKNISSRWVAFGASQGGGASWAANESAATYAPELDLLGSVNASPASDVVGLVAKASAGTLTADQGPVLQWVIEAAARSHPDIVRDDYRRGAAKAKWDVLSACSGQLVTGRAAAAKSLGRFDLAPKDTAAARRLTDLLASYAVSARRAVAPMLVVYGDGDTYIDSEWTTAAIERSCALGDTIEKFDQPGKGHADVDLSGALPWIKARFADEPAPNNCR